MRCSPQTAPTCVGVAVLFLVPAPSGLLTTPDSAALQTNTGATDYCEAGRDPNAQELSFHQMLRTFRKLVLFAISVG